MTNETSLEQQNQITTNNISTENTGVSSTPEGNNFIQGELNPVTRKIVESAINTVLSDYLSKQALFNADSLHTIRLKVTELVKQKLGENEITFVDVGLDLSAVSNIQFFFRIDIPKDKINDHILQSNKENVEENKNEESKKEN